MGRAPLDLTGKTFGTLRPLRRLALKVSRGYAWLCLCDPSLGGCGKHVGVPVADISTRVSCGCRRKPRGRPPGFPSPFVRTERNADIYERWQAGESDGILADEFILSKQRIHQIAEVEAMRRGEELRQESASERYPSRLPFALSDDLRDSLQRGEVSARAAAAEVGVRAQTLRKRLCAEGVSLAKLRKEQARARNAVLYARFMAGATLRELAEEEDIMPGSIQQMILRHRRLTGAPAKCPNLKPRRQA